MSIYHLYKGKDENDGLDLEQQKQNISSFIKAQFSAENLVFFIGSGCSVPAIPLMSQTMKAIIGKHDDILCVIKKFLDTKNVNLLIDSLDDKDILKGVIVQSCKSHSLETIADLYNYIIQTQLLEKEQLLEIYENFCSSFSDIESLLNWIQNVDLEYLLQTIPYINKNQLSRFSYLPTGTAFLVGELFPIPVEVEVVEESSSNVTTTPQVIFK